MSDIQELFARDPLSYTAVDIDQIITEMRRLRGNYQSKPAAAAKVKEKKTAGPAIDLAQLGLIL